MKILIDFTQIPLEKAGVGVYALNQLNEICRLDGKNFYYVLAQDDEKSLDFTNCDNFKIIKVKSSLFRRFVLRSLLEQIYIPYLALKYKIDIVHSLHYSFPVFLHAKKVVTLPDMTVFKMPKRHLISKVLWFRSFIYMAAFLADKVICISRSTQKDFLEKFNFAEKRTQVIYLGKSSLFRPDLTAEEMRQVREKYRINSNYLLYLGTIEPRKNIKNIILAFNKFLEEGNDYQLVIAGKKGWGFEEIFSLVEELHLNSKVVFTGFIDEKDKPYLICGAKIFIYPSIYEGFGIPVLEALACGVPTITSNISSLPEVAGDAALFVEPSSVDDIYSKINKLLNDRALYTQLKQRAVEQASKFSWEKTAQDTIRVYNSLQ